MKTPILLHCLILLIPALPVLGQRSSTLDLPAWLKENKIKPIHRHVSPSPDKTHPHAIHLDTAEGPGIAWLKNSSFANGTIEFDVKGKNVMQGSFVGIAFHGDGDTTYDAVYFRPFNFRNPGRSNHSVQYISLPKYDWFTLRDKYPGKYEKTISPIPDPDQWFHVTVVVVSPRVAVYVNDNKVPSLVVDKLTTRSQGQIGFWVGNGSDGDFDNLTITNN